MLSVICFSMSILCPKLVHAEVSWRVNQLSIDLLFYRVRENLGMTRGGVQEAPNVVLLGQICQEFACAATANF
jgi:hypothetical protein